MKKGIKVVKRLTMTMQGNQWFSWLLLFALFASITIHAISEDWKIMDIAKTHHHINEYIEDNIPASHVYLFEKCNTTSIWWEMPVSKRILSVPSGPTVFIFDEVGKQIDFSLDIGDDPKFQKKWGYMPDNKREISLDELKTMMTSHDEDNEAKIIESPLTPEMKVSKT